MTGTDQSVPVLLRRAAMALYSSLTELVGNTPLLKAENFARENSLKADVFAKLEYFNPAGSVKDRPALSMNFCFPVKKGWH